MFLNKLENPEMKVWINIGGCKYYVNLGLFKWAITSNKFMKLWLFKSKLAKYYYKLMFYYKLGII